MGAEHIAKETPDRCWPLRQLPMLLPILLPMLLPMLLPILLPLRLQWINSPVNHVAVCLIPLLLLIRPQVAVGLATGQSLHRPKGLRAQDVSGLVLQLHLLVLRVLLLLMLQV